MEIAYHIGAHCTDGERILRSLLRDVDRLAAEGTAVPGPGRYRRVLREAIEAEVQAGAAPGTREVLIEAMLDGRETRRVVLSNANFLGMPARLFEGGLFMPRAAAKIAALRRLLPGDRIELHLGLRNPATFVPAVWPEAGSRSLAAWLGGIDPLDIAWSDVIEAIHQAAPDVALTVWCNEDTPLLWGEILAGLAGSADPNAFRGRHDLLASILSPQGQDALRALGSDLNVRGQAEAVADLLARHARPEEVEEEIDLPGWDHVLVEEMTVAYEEDLARIARRGDVAFLVP